MTLLKADQKNTPGEHFKLRGSVKKSDNDIGFSFLTGSTERVKKNLPIVSACT